MIRRSLANRDLAAGFLGLGVALTDLQLRIAFANHVDAATSANDLAVRVPVFERTDAADDFHDFQLTSAVETKCLAGYWAGRYSVIQSTIKDRSNQVISAKRVQKSSDYLFAGQWSSRGHRSNFVWPPAARPALAWGWLPFGRPRIPAGLSISASAPAPIRLASRLGDALIRTDSDGPLDGGFR